MAKPNKTNPENAPQSIPVVNPPEIPVAGKTPENQDIPSALPPTIATDVPASISSEPKPSVNGDNAATPVSPQVATNLVDLMDSPESLAGVVETPLPGVASSTDPVETEEMKRGRGRPPGSKNKPKSPSTIADIVTQETIPNYGLMGELVFDMSA